AETLSQTPVEKIPSVQLSKVNLEKKGSVNIKKSGKVTARLEWESSKDLDLYCFYVTKNNELGKIYYRNLGSPQKSPFIQLDGDSKGKGQETITIHRTEELKYVLFAAYSAISNGIGSFYSMKARAVVDNHQGQQVVSSLYEKNNYAYWVAIAHIDFTSASEMKVSHVEQYSKRFTEKSPLLYADGSFKMNVGKAEFKGFS
ncbi:TerD family protein, partial [Cohnella herbarum]